MGRNKANASVLGWVIAVLGLTGVAPRCLAQSTPVSQERTLHVHTYANSLCGTDEDDLWLAAPAGFNPWNDTLENTGSFCGAEITGLASMESSLTSAQIRAVGRVEHFHPNMPSMTSVSAECSSTLEYTFSVANETPYSINGIMTGGGQLGNLFYYVWVGESDGTRIFSHPGLGSPFGASGVLAPGEYRVELTLYFDYENFIHRGETSGFLTFDFTMDLEGGVECPCDWSRDGVLNSQDFFDFLDSLFTGKADFNESGETDSQDFFDFLACFFEAPDACL